MQGQGEQNRCQVFPVTIGTGSKGRRSRPALTHMEDVERALRPTKLIVAQANVEDDRGSGIAQGAAETAAERWKLRRRGCPAQGRA